MNNYNSNGQYTYLMFLGLYNTRIIQFNEIDNNPHANDETQIEDYSAYINNISKMLERK